MRRIFSHINVSLDGYIDDAEGNIDWHFADEAFQRYLDELLQSIDGMVFGRAAYEQLAAYWPTAGDEVTAVQRSAMRELPKYILSRTLETTGWHNSHLLGDDPVAALGQLKQQQGRDIAVFAGGSAASQLLRSGVLDEIRLVLNPVLLGEGTPLFQTPYPKSTWRLAGRREFASGAVVLSYERGE
ncbi:hypothetical protein BAY61_05190 [Prauserella marina]|uniref:Dihydrofolate reductase n=1 Tax=Prauserella marina TaxID=530584 RepID=A0A222VL49_9PSEU|nr:dihydrofolate reductase family protein [Prauserella marina]ASR34483.1 hypothetical protein BAY61_05190 [Prauserella marina]PWV85920.1 dihydrofolate reductase [Prauserella marina]SDC42304.1 Dihydrofolate reductase [Prauserella marina]